jgi:hypothetical protein
MIFPANNRITIEQLFFSQHCSTLSFCKISCKTRIRTGAINKLHMLQMQIHLCKIQAFFVRNIFFAFSF